MSSGKTEQFAAKAVYVGKAEKACEGKKRLIPLGFEPRTFRVLGGCDNHYTTESALKVGGEFIGVSLESHNCTLCLVGLV